jgi:hypothetical protein
VGGGAVPTAEARGNGCRPIDGLNLEFHKAMVDQRIVDRLEKMPSENETTFELT